MLITLCCRTATSLQYMLSRPIILVNNDGQKKMSLLTNDFYPTECIGIHLCTSNNFYLLVKPYYFKFLKGSNMFQCI